MSSDRTEWRIDPAWAHTVSQAVPILVRFGIRSEANALVHDLFSEAIRRTQQWCDVPIRVERIETAIGFDGIDTAHACGDEVHRAITKLLTEHMSLMAGIRRPLIVIGYGGCPWSPIFREIR